MSEPKRTANAKATIGACKQREADDDFFCLRYQVWYPSFDCAIRTKFQTSPGCARCEQGRFNHKRHATALVRYRFRLGVANDAS